MEESKQKIFKNFIKVIALLLCVFFFTLPLVKGTYSGSVGFWGIGATSSTEGLTATGFQIATGTGELFKAARESSNSVAFFLLVAPIILLALAFTKSQFIVLGIVSIIGLVFKIDFFIVVDMTMRHFLSLTIFNWVEVALYIGLCVFSFYCAKLNKKSTI